MGVTQRLGTIPLAIQTDSSNNVGIGGAANASYKLAVTGAGLYTGALTASTTFTLDGTKKVFLRSNQGTGGGLISGSAIGAMGNFSIYSDDGVAGDILGMYYWNGGTYRSALQFANVSSGSSNLLLMKDGGNVGIGTSSPTGTYGKLSVAGGISILDDNNAKLEIGRYSSGAANSYIKIGTNSASLRITNAADSADLVTFTNSGNVGIGTSSPDNLLDVYGTGTNTTRIRVRGTTNFALFQAQNDSSSALYMGIDSSTASGFNVGNYSRIIWSGGAYPLVIATNDAERMRITSDGAVCFGTTTPGGSGGISIGVDGGGRFLDINRTVSTPATQIQFKNPNGIVGSIVSSGTSVSYNTSSDYRLKEDLNDINGLEKLSAIKVYDFKWKADESRMDGVLAHELAEVLPYAVYGDKDGVDEDGKPIMQGVDYSKIVPVLVKAIQELNAKVTALENK